MCVCVSLSIYIYDYFKIIYFKELAHVIMNDGNSKICRVSPEAGDPKKADVPIQV